MVGRTASGAALLFFTFLLSSCDRQLFDLSENLARPFGQPSSERRCDGYNPLRNAYFGDLHVHSSYSSDAYNFGVRLTPEDAYRYAFGGEVLLPPSDDSGRGTRPARIDRPLDFAAVTDHAETLGEIRLCSAPESPSYNSDFCRDSRAAFGRNPQMAIKIFVPFPWRSESVCGEDSRFCQSAASDAWQETIAAAEEWLDESSACQRTTFVAYEYSSFRNGSNLHRNVVFRNGIVPPQPVSYIEASREWHLWQALDRDCNQSGSGCEALAIPHNSNISNGRMFAVDYPGASDIESQRQRAELRARIEPLVEIMQHKGDSECRNGLDGVLGAVDELCSFEKFENLAFERFDENSDVGSCYEGVGSDWLFRPGPSCLSKLNYVRYALTEGLKERQRLGINPYQFGLSAATDTHNALAGGVQERAFAGHLGLGDDRRVERVAWDSEVAGNTANGPGGVMGVWARQNTRDELFDAMLSKEVFGTSGPRILPRFFAAPDYPAGLCLDPELLRKAYADGVPMGAEMPPLAVGQSPRFLAMASADVGSADFPGTPLQRLQIVKGWSDGDGNTQQRVFDVAGDADNGAGVDLQSCQPYGEGFSQLCTVWTDPTFDAAQSAFYYLRAVENPSCRYNAWQCLELPSAQRPASCRGDHPKVKLTQQERAWSSPIWYFPPAED